MAIVVWTKAKPHLIRDTVGKIISSLGSPPHRVSSTPGVPSLEPGDTLLCLGSKNLKFLQDAGITPKNRSIESMRGQAIKFHESTILCSYDPYVMNDDHGSYVKLQIDTMMAVRNEVTGSIEPEIGEYKYVADFGATIKKIERMYEEKQKPIPISVDLETVGLDPFDPEKWIVSISVTYKTGMAHVVYFEKGQPLDAKLRLQIEWLLNSPMVIVRGANFKYDRLWMGVKWEMECTRHRMDTTLVGSLMDENRSNSLNTHAKLYTAMGGYDDAFNLKYDKSKMHKVPKEDLLPYAGGDTDAALRVSFAMAKELALSPRLYKFYTRLLHPASEAFLDMEREGVLIDVDYYRSLEEQLTSALEDLTEKARQMMPRKLQIKYMDDFKLTRDVIKRDYLFGPKGLKLTPMMLTEKDKLPSTAEKHLKMFEDVPEAKEFMQILKEFGTTKKTLGTYVTGFLKHVRADGRLHPTAILYRGEYDGDGEDSGARTGRLAFKDPAIQTIPKHTFWAKALREGYIAPPGYVIVNWDYSQGELRVIACIANEPHMIAAYREGIDLHSKTGAELNGYTMEQLKHMDEKKVKWIRQGGKAGNFGLIYGMMPKGYQAYAKDTYGVSIALQEATAQRDAFFKLYPVLLDYHDKYKAMAHKHGAVISPLGRIRHLPLINSRSNDVMMKAERQAINSPVQSTLSDLSQLSLAQFRKEYGRPDDCRFCMMTHDSLTAYVKADKVQVWGPRMKAIMENLPLKELFGWQPQLTFEVDWEVGPNLKDLKEAA